MSGVFSAPVLASAAYTTAIDFFELLSNTGQPLDLLYFEIGQPSEIGDAQEEQLILAFKRVTASPTSGSGGTTATFRPVIPGGSPGATLETGNTTKCSGGTSVELWRKTWNLRGPFIFDPKDYAIPRLDAATRFVLELVSAPNDSITGVYGEIVIDELI